MKRYKVIANPASGRGKAARQIPLVERYLKAAGLSYELTRTAGHWHAVDLARQAARQGFDVVVAAGGDGTINEVINGLMEVRQTGAAIPALGVLCIGRGNDFAYGMGIPETLEAGVQALARDQRWTIDIGKVTGGLHLEGRYFGNCVGVGFDAVGTIEAAKLPAFLGGFLTYLIAVLRTIFLYHIGPIVEISYGQMHWQQGALMVSIMNGKRIGGGFLMAPGAEPDDGMLDLCIAGQGSRRRILQLVPHFTRGTQASQPEITTGQTDALVVRAVKGVLPAQTDGEILCVDGDRLEIELLPRQLEVVVGNVQQEGR